MVSLPFIALLLLSSDQKWPRLRKEHISDYHLTHRNQKTKVEGVCKITEEEFGCWKPNGSRDVNLTKRVKEIISTQRSISEPQLHYTKNNVILVMTNTTKLSAKKSKESNQESYVNLESSPATLSSSQPCISGQIYSLSKERWRAFDPIVTTVLQLCSFEKSTSTFSLGFQFFDSTQNSVVVPAKPSVFSAGGNVYKILEIMETKSQEKPFGASRVTVQPLRITNPNTIIHMKAADDKGIAFEGTDLKGNPIGSQDLKRLRDDRKSKVSTSNDQSTEPQFLYLSSVIVDPYIDNYSGTSFATIDLRPKKIMTFVAQVFQRRAISLDNIHLKPR